MKTETIEKLCCPFDKAGLTLTVITRDLDEAILEGMLHCNHCKRVYPVISGIPVMSPDEYREFHIEQPLLDRWTKGQVSADFRLAAENPGVQDERV